MSSHKPFLFATAALLISTGLMAQDARSIGPFYKGIGNSWLGGSVSLAGSLSRSTTLSTRTGGVTRTGRANLAASADASILRFSLRAVQVDLTAQNAVTQRVGMLPTQSASGSFRLQLCGILVNNRSVQTTGNLGGIPETEYKLFPSDVRAPVGVGPFTVTLGGNAGVTLGAGAMVILPTTTPEVRLLASGSTSVLGRAFVSVGVLGFAAGVELRARFAEQRLTMGVTASVLNGLSGTVGYEIQAMSLRLIAFLETFWTRVYSTTLTSWSSGWVGRELLN